jgi:DNA-binding CsgD family transcriptional regulator
MTRRGRPPHPDILTPRQWEILDLLRLGYSDQQIADALDLTLAGAKYHVSEILTKLNVSSREQAAAWQPSQPHPPWWRRALALSLAVKLAGAAIVAAAVVGIGLLAYGVAVGGSDEAAFEPLNLPPPITPPTLTREQAAAIAGETFEMGDVRAVDIEPTTIDGVNLYDMHFHLFSSTATVWLVRARSFATQYEGNPGGPAFPPSPITGCRELVAEVADARGVAPGGSAGTDSGPSAGPLLPNRDCAGDFSSSLAIFVSAGYARTVAADLSDELPDVGAAKLAYDEADVRMQTLFGGSFGQTYSGDDVWLVTFDFQCAIAAAIVREPGVILASNSKRSDC